MLRNKAMIQVRQEVYFYTSSIVLRNNKLKINRTLVGFWYWSYYTVKAKSIGSYILCLQCLLLQVLIHIATQLLCRVIRCISNKRLIVHCNICNLSQIFGPWHKMTTNIISLIHTFPCADDMKGEITTSIRLDFKRRSIAVKRGLFPCIKCFRQ